MLVYFARFILLILLHCFVLQFTVVSLNQQFAKKSTQTSAMESLKLAVSSKVLHRVSGGLTVSLKWWTGSKALFHCFSIVRFVVHVLMFMLWMFISYSFFSNNQHNLLYWKCLNKKPFICQDECKWMAVYTICQNF